jgi:hypothetical protein
MYLIFVYECAGKDATKDNVGEVSRVNFFRHSKKYHILKNSILPNSMIHEL